MAALTPSHLIRWLTAGIPFRVFGLWAVTYPLIMLGHLAVQQLFATCHAISKRRAVPDPSEWPRVAVVVPVYNEQPDMLERCLASIDGQDYPYLAVWAVDDGSPNRSELQAVYDAHPLVTTVLLDGNVGKRNAQAVVFDRANLGPDGVFVTVDSDTVIAPGGLRRIVAPFTRNRQLGAVTGDVRALNHADNLLTRLIGLRYWIAFHQERAAQSLFGVVACCSGPFSAYRASLVDRVKADYIDERFLGTVCTFGDDRHLTNLILAEGVDVEFCPQAVAYTHVPTRIGVYLRQQTRWAKSSVREAIWTFRHVRNRHPYLYVDLALQGLLPFVLLAVLGRMAWRSATIDWTILLRYILIVALIGLLRSLYGAVATRRPSFFVFAVYGFVNVGLLIPTRCYAMLTINRTHWGTRGKRR